MGNPKGLEPPMCESEYERLVRLIAVRLDIISELPNGGVFPGAEFLGEARRLVEFVQKHDFRIQSLREKVGADK